MRSYDEIEEMITTMLKSSQDIDDNIAIPVSLDVLVNNAKLVGGVNMLRWVLEESEIKCTICGLPCNPKVSPYIMHQSCWESINNKQEITNDSN